MIFLLAKIDDYYKLLIPVLCPASRVVEASTIELVSQRATMYRHTLANIRVAFENDKDPLIPDLNISTQISGHALLRFVPCVSFSGVDTCHCLDSRTADGAEGSSFAWVG